MSRSFLCRGQTRSLVEGSALVCAPPGDRPANLVHRPPTVVREEPCRVRGGFARISRLRQTVVRQFLGKPPAAPFPLMPISRVGGDQQIPDPADLECRLFLLGELQDVRGITLRGAAAK